MQGRCNAVFVSGEDLGHTTRLLPFIPRLLFVCVASELSALAASTTTIIAAAVRGKQRVSTL